MVSDFLVRLSIRSAMFAGAITGFVFGLFAGATLGALISWFAGAIVDWQAQLGFSLGVTQQLLPLGDQVNSLETVADRWFLVIPGVGLLVGVLGALIGLLAGGLWAALVNMGVLPIEVTVYRPGEHAPRRRATDKPAPPFWTLGANSQVTSGSSYSPASMKSPGTTEPSESRPRNPSSQHFQGRRTGRTHFGRHL